MFLEYFILLVDYGREFTKILICYSDFLVKVVFAVRSNSASRIDVVIWNSKISERIKRALIFLSRHMISASYFSLGLHVDDCAIVVESSIRDELLRLNR